MANVYNLIFKKWFKGRKNVLLNFIIHSCSTILVISIYLSFICCFKFFKNFFYSKIKGKFIFDRLLITCVLISFNMSNKKKHLLGDYESNLKFVFPNYNWLFLGISWQFVYNELKKIVDYQKIFWISQKFRNLSNYLIKLFKVYIY